MQKYKAEKETCSFDSFIYSETNIWAETDECWEEGCDNHNSKYNEIKEGFKCKNDVSTEMIEDIKHKINFEFLQKSNEDLLLKHNDIVNNDSYLKNLTINTLNTYTYIIAFDSGRTQLGISKNKKELNTYVVIEADRGEDIGRVMSIYDKSEECLTDEIFEKTVRKYEESTRAFFKTNYKYSDPKKIYRDATIEEIEMLKLERKESEKNALIYINYIKEVFSIEMEVTKCEFQFDLKRITFYYKSTKRIDFRELVKELFKHYKIRIWMCSENREFYK